jgi:hypothetical protein
MGGRPIDVANPGVAAPPEGGSLSRGCQQRRRRGNRGLPDPVGDGAGGAALAISSCALEHGCTLVASSSAKMPRSSATSAKPASPRRQAARELGAIEHDARTLGCAPRWPSYAFKHEDLRASLTPSRTTISPQRMEKFA